MEVIGMVMWLQLTIIMDYSGERNDDGEGWIKEKLGFGDASYFFN
jgi:hypothetical protein